VSVLRGERVVLRPLRLADAPRLAELGREPAVARWWPGITVEELVEKAEGRDDAVAFTIELDAEPIGLAQYWEEDDPEFRHAGLDLFLGTEFHGRGLGADTVRTLARHLVSDREHHRLVIDPALANERAIRCYERVGFRRVGVLRRYQRFPDGTWHDGLLLDLLAEDLYAAPDVSRPKGGPAT
jgi:aminoglycoside 6'-N-acetyltransferase